MADCCNSGCLHGGDVIHMQGMHNNNHWCFNFSLCLDLATCDSYVHNNFQLYMSNVSAGALYCTSNYMQWATYIHAKYYYRSYSIVH